MEKSVISVAELASELGISRPTAYDLVRSDGFPHIRIGRRILVPTAALRDWLARQAEQEARGA